jgi:hypothetical protein
MHALYYLTKVFLLIMTSCVCVCVFTQTSHSYKLFNMLYSIFIFYYFFMQYYSLFNKNATFLQTNL